MSAQMSCVRSRLAPEGMVPDGCPLTPGEFRVLRAVVDTDPDRLSDLAPALGIKPSTVRTHLRNACRKTGSASTRGLVLKAAQMSWYGWAAPPVDKPVRVGRFERTYLEAFDAYLRSGSDRDRRAMSVALNGMRSDAGVRGELERPLRDPILRLARSLARAA